MSTIERIAIAALLLGFFLSGVTRAETVIHVTHAEVAFSKKGNLAQPPLILPAPAWPTQWQTASLPYVAPREILPGAKEQVVTRWFRISLGDSPAVPEPLYLYLPRWQTVGKVAVYADDKLLYSPRGSPVWNGYNHPLWIRLAGANETPPRQVVIRMDSFRGAGGALSTVWIGSESSLSSARFLRELIQAAIPETGSVAFLFIGLFSFAVWLKRRRESVYLLFFASSLFSYLRSMHYYLGLEPLPIPDHWFGWVTVSSLGWFILTVYFFSYRLHGRHYPCLERWLVGMMLLSSALLIPPLKLLPNLGLLAPLAYLILLGVVVVCVVAMCFAAWRSRSKEALLFSLWNLTSLPLGIHDWMLQNYLLNIEGVYLLPYFSLGSFFLFMTIVFHRYIGAINEVEAVNRSLEERLREREAQLAESYERLREAEHQQILAEERQRLVRDMHDGFGSSLIGALSVVEHGGPAVNVAQVLRECIDDLRLIIDSLEPLDADLSLLLASLRYRLTPRLEAAGITLNWNATAAGKLEWLTPKSALQILRILQEVFTNIFKHAGAHQVRVSAEDGPCEIVVEIEDDGQGFEIKTARASGGRGLANLMHRAESIGASAHWDSRPGRTLFQLRLPLTPHTRRAA